MKSAAATSRMRAARFLLLLAAAAPGLSQSENEMYFALSSGHTFSPVGFLFHAEVANGQGTLETLSQHGVGRVDERLDQFHLHG